MEFEHWKCVGFVIAAALAKFGGHIASVAATDDFGKWIERGGTGLSVLILLMGLRYLRDKLESREKRLDEIMERDRVIHEKDTESRFQLSSALERLTETIEKK